MPTSSRRAQALPSSTQRSVSRMERLCGRGVEALRKPLAAVIITHAHPDHYGGVAALLGDADVPVYAVAGVNDVIRRDDAAKEHILRPMFGDEWPATRTCASALDSGQVRHMGRRRGEG
jgi:glyoxylase-like metal-dependent hydrolase (beta-lactamase superfamily II)